MSNLPEYEIPAGAEGVLVRVRNTVVYIKAGDDGVSVDLWPKAYFDEDVELDGPTASTYIEWNEHEPEEEEGA